MKLFQERQGLWLLTKEDAVAADSQGANVDGAKCSGMMVNQRGNDARFRSDSRQAYLSKKS